MIGQQISHYSIIEKLGEGGMGEVYLAEDLDLKRSVALKVLPADVASDPERLARFRREAESLAAINHPNIVTIFSIEKVSDLGDLHIMTMERVEGRGLDELLSEAGMPLDRLLDIAIPLSDALAAAHDKGITHRDLKPENLMLTGDGRLKVLDFGLAKLRREGQSQLTAADRVPLVTREQAIIGTVPYMSPEQIDGGEVDGRSDLFSFGIVLFELATGQRPFRGKSAPAVMSAILGQAPLSLRQVRADLPVGLEQIIGRCLQKDPAQRYQQATEVRRDLQALRADPGARTAWRLARWSRVRRAAAAIALALVVGLVVWQSTLAENMPRLAVMPFDTGSADDDAWFAAAITHGVAERLSSVEDLVVRRPRVDWKDKTPEQIGAAIGVDYLLRATVFLVQKEGGRRILITPELSRTSDGGQLPIPSCDQAIPGNDDVLEVQRLVANQILDRLGMRRSRLSEAGTAPTANTEAWKLYQQGRYFFAKRDEDSLNKALECYEQAAELDPDFALAHAGIASIPGAQAWYCLIDPTVAYHQAVAPAEKALAADPELPQAIVNQATLYPYILDFDKTVRAHRRAIELSASNPQGYPSAHQWLSYPLAWSGYDEEAMREVMTAHDLDPVSPIITTWVGLTHYYFGRHDEALRWMDEALGLDPDFVPGLWHRTWVCGVAGRHDEAIANAEKVRSLAPENPVFTVNLAWAYALSGRRTEARELLAEVAEIARRRYVSSYQLAAVHVALGEPDEAFRLLRQSIKDKASWRGALNVDQRFLPLRGDPRFTTVLEQLGLREER